MRTVLLAFQPTCQSYRLRNSDCRLRIAKSEIQNPKSEMSLGDYSGGAPPLPIPNREVKPVSADGTANCGRVGRRRL